MRHSAKGEIKILDTVHARVKEINLVDWAPQQEKLGAEDPDWDSVPRKTQVAEKNWLGLRTE